jgi:hypothetical protein
MRRGRALLGALGIVAILSAVLTACAAPSEDTAPTEDPAQTLDTDLDAAWLDGGRTVGLVTQGSSTCVPSAGGSTPTACCR